MDTAGQLSVFLISIAIGVLGGVLYEPFHVLRVAFGCDRGKRAVIAIALDLLFWLVFSAFCVALEYAFRFGNVRPYTWLGYVAGGTLYLIFLHRIVAFFERVCYNKIVKLAKRRKKRDKTLTKRGKRRV